MPKKKAKKTVKKKKAVKKVAKVEEIKEEPKKKPKIDLSSIPRYYRQHPNRKETYKNLDI